MLRRTATTIKLNPEDILEYDDSLAKSSQQFAYNETTNNDEQDHSILKFKDQEPLTRDERIGSHRQTRIQQPQANHNNQ